MTLQDRDKRALGILAAALLVTGTIYFWPGTGEEIVQASVDSIPAAERRLQKLREVVATLPGREKTAAALGEQLKSREKGMLRADTAAQAQAMLLQTLRGLARKQAPPVELGQYDTGLVQPIGKDYGEALVGASLTCTIEQLVNLLADISAQPELISTHEITINAADEKKKTMNIRLTISGIVPKSLLPERKGAGLF